MNFNVITLMPEFVESTMSYGVVGRSITKEICKINTVNPRDFTSDVHQTIDDRPFGGGDGMLMMVEPLEKSLSSLNLQSNDDVYFLSPQGEVFSDDLAKEWSLKKEITFICGRYGGVDQRFLSKNNIKEISIGDYVLSGGELGASVIMDAVIRKIPGVLGHSSSAEEDSFSGNGLLESPYFTRPQEYQGLSVPKELLCGDHKKIERYRYLSSVLVTLSKRPDLVNNMSIDWDAVKNFIEKMSSDDARVCGFNKVDLLEKISKVDL